MTNRIDHTYCLHPATKSARRACRLRKATAVMCFNCETLYAEDVPADYRITTSAPVCGETDFPVCSTCLDYNYVTTLDEPILVLSSDIIR